MWPTTRLPSHIIIIFLHVTGPVIQGDVTSGYWTSSLLHFNSLVFWMAHCPLNGQAYKCADYVVHLSRKTEMYTISGYQTRFQWKCVSLFLFCVLEALEQSALVLPAARLNFKPWRSSVEKLKLHQFWSQGEFSAEFAALILRLLLSPNRPRFKRFPASNELAYAVSSHSGFLANPSAKLLLSAVRSANFVGRLLCSESTTKDAAREARTAGRGARVQ